MQYIDKEEFERITISKSVSKEGKKQRSHKVYLPSTAMAKAMRIIKELEKKGYVEAISILRSGINDTGNYKKVSFKVLKDII